MLAQRVATSIVLLVLILSAVFYFPPTYFVLFISLVMGIAIWEWSALAGFSSMLARLCYVLVMIILMAIIRVSQSPLTIVLLLGGLFWIIAFLFIFIFPAGRTIWANNPVLILAGVPLFIPGWLAFTFLRSQDHFQFLILLLFFLVAAADIGAYFAGRRFGKHKLAVLVSPNKTWEGFFGGMLACMLLVIITALVFSENLSGLNLTHWLKLLVSAILISVFSVVGDLFESMIKRFRNVKDSGKILPGHGGILDRIDSLTSAAPIYVVLVMLLGSEFL